MACHVEAAYAARKKVESKLDFHDLLVRTRDLLRENAAVRVAVHSQVKFLLLDELQDTDSVQMELVELILSASAFAAAASSPSATPSRASIAFAARTRALSSPAR